MRSSETRSVNQCTYTPVVNETRTGHVIEGFVPRKPWLKLALLGSVADHKLDPLLLREVQADTRISDAMGKLLAGDTRAAAEAVAEVDSAEVLRFGVNYVKAQRSRLELASREVEKVLLDLASTRNSAAADIGDLRTKVATALPVVAGEQPKVYMSRAALLGEAERVVTAVAAAAKQSSVLAIDLDEVQRHVVAKAPDAAKFLASTGYFELPTYYPKVVKAQAAHLLAFDVTKAHLLDQTLVQLRTFERLLKVEPIGFLHLEKLDFTPIGYQRGELVYSLPMLPGETIRMTHRQWSRTESEFEKIVTDSIETYSEEALTEKSELATSMTEEQKHSSAFNASARVSGSYGPVTVSAEAGYNATSSDAQSRTHAAKSSREVTSKASSRVKKESKITFRVTNIEETEDTSFREIKNDTPNAVRWDFHRLMKKWKISLYRYDIRLTYDLVIPEPASFLMRKFVRLQRLKAEHDRGFSLNFSPSLIARNNWPALAATYGVALEAPPPETVAVVANDMQTKSSRVVGVADVEVRLPEGYTFESWDAAGGEVYKGDKRAGFIEPLKAMNTSRLNAGGKNMNSYLWTYQYDWSEPEEVDTGTTLAISVFATGRITPAAMAVWQAKCFERLADAARGKYEAKKAALRHEIDELENELYREDALVLRKIETEELMKGVLRWLLGPQFSFYPDELPDLDLSEYSDLSYYDGKGSLKQAKDHENVLKHGELVRFLHQAIEWENLVYVLYPYFWTDSDRWSFKQSLYHNDFVHRSFLRAGAARVVLTIRPGFEEAFLSYVETLDYEKILPDDHPYITVAQEMKAMAQTNYPYTPAANEQPKENLIDFWYEFTPTGALDVVAGTTLDDDNVDPDA
ncbi:MAG TPA: hypothetical protein VFM55_13475 [Micromonosporaceae bacterium]|nr:hypothetical protein [Micromonosporaceae bacterium]